VGYIGINGSGLTTVTVTKTLSGSVKMLTEVLSLVSPTAFGRAARIRNPVRKIAQVLGENELWMFEIAAMLSQVGCVAIPETSWSGSAVARSSLVASRRRLLHTLWLAGTCSRRFLAWKRCRNYWLPREAIRWHRDTAGRTTRKDIPAGSRILKVALDYDSLASRGSTPEMAIGELQHRLGWYDRT